MVYAILAFAPLLGSLIAGLFGRWLGDKASQWLTTGLMALSLLCAIIGLASDLGEPARVIVLARWIDELGAAWSLRIDSLSLVMMFVVTSVSFLVHLYSIGYMSHDSSIARFMSYLSLFTFAMLMLVTSNDLVQLFFGWEGVGLASYLLIGFWHSRPSACAAAIKAFVVNRVGDVGLALGVALLFFGAESAQYDLIFEAAPRLAEETISIFGIEADLVTAACLLLFMGAMGKSAQLGLHTWLPDAMEGPTPVSALIHAATMVTAGVFLLARMSPLYELAPFALAVVTLFGASTAFFAATVGLTQTDIKRVIAYSTCSQLGYMFFACGVGAYGAAIFHLFTHAFFKALLFLGAGSVIHAMSDEQDMRKMGGIWRAIPFTYAMMWIGTLALIGFPLTAGFFSKDAIIESAWAAHGGVAGFAFAMGLIAAVMTAFYSLRLMLMTFHGAPRASKEVMRHVHESPMVMTAPLGLLAVGALFSGFAGLGMIGADGAFWAGAIHYGPDNRVLEDAHHAPLWVKASPFVMMCAGAALAWLAYVRLPGLPAIWAERFAPLYALSFNKWWFDELYDALFVAPAKRLGQLFWKSGDLGAIDRFGPDGVAASALATGRKTSAIQSGYVNHYAFSMLIGVVALLALLFWRGGAP